MRITRKCVLHALLLITVFFAQSCTRPNSGNVPLLTQQNDFRLSGALSLASETSGFEIQSAYALTNHFGTMLNFYNVSGNEKSSNNGRDYEKGSGTYAEFGGGYFKNLDITKNVTFETYAGIGTGGIKNQYSPVELSKVNVTKLFIQPSIGYTGRRGILQAAISSRFSSAHMNLKQNNLTTTTNTDDYKQLQDLKKNLNAVYWEPSFLVRMGAEKIKLQLEYTISKALKKGGYRTQPDLMSLGITFSFNGKTSP